MFKIILIDIKSNYKYLNVHLSNGEIKEIFLSKSFRFNWGVFKKQIEFEYFGGDLRWKSITRLTLRSILEYRVLGLMKFLRCLFFRYSGHFYDPNFSSGKIFFSFPDDKRPLLVSRSAMNHGIVPTYLSHEIEWNRVRKNNLFSGYIIDVESNLEHLSKLNIYGREINSSLSLRNITEIESLKTSKSENLILTDVEVIFHVGLLQDGIFYALNDRDFIETTSWPTDKIISVDSGKFSYISRKAPIEYELERASYFGSTSNWFHFITEVLPRIIEFKVDFTKFPLLTDKSLPKSIIDLCKFVSHDNLILHESIASCKVHSLNTSMSSPIHSHDSNQLKELEIIRVRNYFQHNFVSSQNIFNNILIKRPINGLRKLLNYPEIEEYLLKRNFIVVNPEFMTFEDQINVFQSAKLVIAEPGAALTNLIFCSKQTKVIELNPGYGEFEFWKKYSSLFHFQHHIIYGRKRRFSQFGEFSIDISEFKSTLEKLLD